MIQNKKLFIATITIMFLLCLGIDVPVLLLGLVPVGSLGYALFFIGNAVLSTVAYSLLYRSLKKTEIVKNIYKFILVLASIVFIIGIIMLFLNL